MRGCALAVAAVALLVGSVPASQSTTGVAVDKAFAPGGTITMKLAAGDYQISGRSDQKIRVAWRVDHAEDASRVKAEADIRGTTALVATTGVKNGMHFTIDVPARSDIDVDLSAGDLEIRGIEGSKKVGSWAGDVSIDVGKAEQYPGGRGVRPRRRPVRQAVQRHAGGADARLQVVRAGPVRAAGEAFCRGFDASLRFLQTSTPLLPS